MFSWNDWCELRMWSLTFINWTKVTATYPCGWGAIPQGSQLVSLPWIVGVCSVYRAIAHLTILSLCGEILVLTCANIWPRHINAVCQLNICMAGGFRLHSSAKLSRLWFIQFYSVFACVSCLMYFCLVHFAHVATDSIPSISTIIERHIERVFEEHVQRASMHFLSTHSK